VSKDDIVAQIILGEAANQDLAGLDMVADTIFNRSHAQGRSLEEVATAPKQFSAANRDDLKEFYNKQPIFLRKYAEALVQERRNPEFQPSHPYQHYVTQELWNRRDQLPKKHWLHDMEAVSTVGDHVFLQDSRTNSNFR
jgi:spore germination cell wall hydrolase CwlJ-like protein